MPAAPSSRPAPPAERPRGGVAARLAAALWQPIREFAGQGGDSTFLATRWLVLRAVGAVFVVVFAGIVADASALLGPQGLAPLSGFFAEWATTHPEPLTAFLRAPSLFWLSASPLMIGTVAWAGLVAALAVTFNLWPRPALAVCWLGLLSFVSTWRGFSASQVDQLMLETGLLCVPFAPAGFRPGLGAASPVRPIALFALRWLLFRVMFESGLVKIFAGDPRWRDLTALDVLYETSPFPTFLGFLDHQLPHAWHVGEFVLTFAAEIAAPLLAVWGGRRGRWWAFAAWSALQVGIQLTNNFGWLNTASLGLGLLLLDDAMLAGAAARLRWPRLAARLRTPAPAVAAPSGWRLHGLRVALGGHAVLSVYFFALACGLPTEGFPFAAGRPLRDLFADFRSANAYTLFAGLLPGRVCVEFEGSDDGGDTWRTYEYRYLPQREDQISPFLAPRYARFEATLQVESNRPEASPLFRLVGSHLLAGRPAVLGWFRRNPFPDRPPALLRLPVHRLTFTDWATYRKTGHFWRREPAGFYGPLLYRAADGTIATADSPLAELRARAENGSAAAQNRLGFAYATGADVPRNPAEAARWYARAAERGLAEAQSRLGVLHAYGEGVPRNLETAAGWFRRAADQGEVQAQFFLGLCLARGDGVARHPAEAARYYHLAARQGHAPAQTNLGFLLLQGDGAARDDVEALAWLQVAARSGLPESVKALASATQRVGERVAAQAQPRAEALWAEIQARHPRP